MSRVVRCVRAVGNCGLVSALAEDVELRAALRRLLNQPQVSVELLVAEIGEALSVSGGKPVTAGSASQPWSAGRAVLAVEAALTQLPLRADVLGMQRLHPLSVALALTSWALASLGYRVSAASARARGRTDFGHHHPGQQAARREVTEALSSRPSGGGSGDMDMHMTWTWA